MYSKFEIARVRKTWWRFVAFSGRNSLMSILEGKKKKTYQQFFNENIHSEAAWALLDHFDAKFSQWDICPKLICSTVYFWCHYYSYPFFSSFSCTSRPLSLSPSRAFSIARCRKFYAFSEASGTAECTYQFGRDGNANYGKFMQNIQLDNALGRRRGASRGAIELWLFVQRCAWVSVYVCVFRFPLRRVTRWPIHTHTRSRQEPLRQTHADIHARGARNTNTKACTHLSP